MDLATVCITRCINRERSILIYWEVYGQYLVRVWVGPNADNPNRRDTHRSVETVQQASEEITALELMEGWRIAPSIHSPAW
jgi:hypothetical protein